MSRKTIVLAPILSLALSCAFTCPVLAGDPPGTRPVILYGGSFCPPHRTHLEEALAAQRFLGAGEVVFIPSSPGAMQYVEARRTVRWESVTAAQRLAMTWLATRSHPGFTVSACEVGRPAPGYSSATTILDFARSRRGPVWVLIGTDVMEGLARWSRVGELLSSVNLLVSEYPPTRVKALSAYLPPSLASRYTARGPGVFETRAGRRIVFTRLVNGGLSSREVRGALSARRPVDSLLSPLVIRYIEHFGLFHRGEAD